MNTLYSIKGLVTKYREGSREQVTDIKAYFPISLTSGSGWMWSDGTKLQWNLCPLGGKQYLRVGFKVVHFGYAGMLE